VLQAETREAELSSGICPVFIRKIGRGAMRRSRRADG
jgi:hypothetical protein